MPKKDKKDEIIHLQTEILRTMTEQNLRRIGSDFWGNPSSDRPAPPSRTDTLPGENRQTPKSEAPAKTAETAGSGTGIYGIFRDLAAPFGVAVFVPFFTNTVSRLSVDTTMNLSVADAAISSIHILAMFELFCVIIGIVIVQLLPKIHKTEYLKGE